MNEKKDILMKSNFRRLLMIQVVSSMSAFIGPIIDGIVISDFLGASFMAAFGLLTPITILLSAFANIFNAGSQNKAGKLLGRGKTDELNALMSSTFAWAAVLGAIVMFCLLVLT